jgi:ABC-type dipeptide/oligopeptide/nickel transport system ATPase subunit
MPAICIKLKNIQKSYGEKLVLDGISLDLQPGEFVGLRGPSGVGKSTLGRIVCGLETADSGQVFWDERPINISIDMRLELVPWLPQNAEAALNPLKTVKKLLEEVCLLRQLHIKKSDLHSRVLDVLEQVELSADLFGYRPPELSGGMNQRLLLARILLTEPDALVLDEFVTGLDASTAASLVGLVYSLKTQRTLTCLVISHEEAVLRFLCDRIYTLNAGKLQE